MVEMPDANFQRIVIQGSLWVSHISSNGVHLLVLFISNVSFKQVIAKVLLILFMLNLNDFQPSLLLFDFLAQSLNW